MEKLKVKFREMDVGTISFNKLTKLCTFQYNPSFIDTKIELSPIKMPLIDKVYSFPELDYAAFKGLPGMIADSLPDSFGEAVMNTWFRSVERKVEITPVMRLKLIGKRGMGALTYHPSFQKKNLNLFRPLKIDSLVKSSQEVLDNLDHIIKSIEGTGALDIDGIINLLSVGISAGGARPKAILSFNTDLTKACSGKSCPPDGFKHCIIKFDGVSEKNKKRETYGDPTGYGVMEYVYYLMASKCRIDMMPCHLLNEGKRRHFVTERFDRKGSRRYHIQTLNGMVHASFKKTGFYSYEELFEVADVLGLNDDEKLQLFRRMAFNIVARNHDDHSKNTSFILDDDFRWKLAPAYDLAYSYRPESFWINSHWMMMNGKREGFLRDDFHTFERKNFITRKMIDEILDETIENVSMWQKLAKENEVPEKLISLISENLRLKI